MYTSDIHAIANMYTSDMYATANMYASDIFYSLYVPYFSV